MNVSSTSDDPLRFLLPISFSNVVRLKGREGFISLGRAAVALTFELGEDLMDVDFGRPFFAGLLSNKSPAKGTLSTTTCFWIYE